jgi:ATP-dependent protease ClpP protease subunit
MLFRILNAATPEAIEIAVYDFLGKSFFGDGVDETKVLAAINSKPKAKSITVRVSSIGGIFDTAKTILNLLAERATAGVSVEFRVESLAASAAAYLLTTPGARVVVAKNAFVMIHKTRGGMRGTDTDMAAAAERLRAENQVLVDALAAASARRSKGKTAADFNAAIANNADRYFSASEAVEWGIADAVTDPAMQVAACSVDVSGIEDLPEAIRTAPYAVLNVATEPPSVPALPPPVLAQAELPFASPTTPPAPAREPITNTTPAPGGPGAPLTEIQPMLKKILAALTLSEETGEEAVVVAINKLKASAKLGADVEQLLGATGPQALGAVRALKEAQETNANLAEEVAKLKVSNARRDFETARDQGLKDRKLTPATAKLYTDRFEAAAKDDGDCASIVDDLQGFLKVAPRVVSLAGTQPRADGGPESPTQHNGKAFEEMKPADRVKLKKENPELYTTLREDAVARGAV